MYRMWWRWGGSPTWNCADCISLSLSLSHDESLWDPIQLHFNPPTENTCFQNVRRLSEQLYNLNHKTNFQLFKLLLFQFTDNIVPVPVPVPTKEQRTTWKLIYIKKKAKRNVERVFCLYQIIILAPETEWLITYGSPPPSTLRNPVRPHPHTEKDLSSGWFWH